MNFSYDYEELIQEVKGDLAEGLIAPNDTLKIVRGPKIGPDYYPIIDYYYDDNKPNEFYTEMTVSEVIKEMEHMNRIIK